MKRINEHCGNPAANGYININNDIHFYVTKVQKENTTTDVARVDSKG
jgi:hypothetical protein